MCRGAACGSLSGFKVGEQNVGTGTKECDRGVQNAVLFRQQFKECAESNQSKQQK